MLAILVEEPEGILNISGQGWRDRVPELNEDPTKTKKEEDAPPEPLED